jgi:hypothetical protein
MRRTLRAHGERNGVIVLATDPSKNAASART